MSKRRVRVLEIGAEGGGFELDAEIDDQSAPLGFFAWEGGPHGFENAFDEQPASSVAHGPLTWSAVLETYLRPHGWLEQYPQVLHPSIAQLVREELPHASADGRARWETALRAATFRETILRAYRRAECINPFIGDAFAGGVPNALRVMTVGLNAYLSEADWPKQNPDWFAGWFRDGTHKFDRTVATDAGDIARALIDRSPHFSGLTFDGRTNFFHTNAVKAYLREADGKRSDQVTQAHFQAHVATWHAELDAMAQHGVLPHVIIVFGQPFWERAWQAFYPEKKPAFSHLRVHGFVSAGGEGHPHANRVEVEGGRGKHPLALLGVRHPAARATSKATPDWLLSQPGVRELFGLP